MGWLKGDDTAKSKSRPSSSRFSSLSISQLSLDVPTGAANVSEVENDDDDDDDDDEIGMIELGIPLIPVDLFARKKKQQKLTFTDAFNNIVFHGQVSGGSSRGCLLLDSSGRRPLLSILPYHGGNWRAFKGDNSGLLLFTVKRTFNTFGRIELTVVPSGQNGADSSPAFKMRGSVFWRSFCIYRDDAIIAQTSLMYTLGFRKVFVSRSKFRITVFPGFSDQTLIAGLVLVFLDGRK